MKFPALPRSVLLAAAGLALGLAGGCFTSIFVPPTFRYACDTDADCRPTVDETEDGEFTQRCIGGLCQYPCTGSPVAPVEGECPSDFFGCFNGVCATLCQLDEGLCSAPMRCIGFDIPPELAGQLGGGFGSFDFENTGICGVECDAEGAGPCPEGQLCFEGVCVDLSSLTTTGGDASTGGSSDTDTDTSTGGAT